MYSKRFDSDVSTGGAAYYEGDYTREARRNRRNTKIGLVIVFIALFISTLTI